MNDKFEERLSDVARRGLEHRLGEVPSKASVAVVKACAAQHARRIRILRSMRYALPAVASVAACLVLLVVVFRDSGFSGVESAQAKNYRPYLVLTALTTVFPTNDDGALTEGDLMFSDFEEGTDFDAFAESLLRMQDSACVLDSAVAWN